MVSLTSLWLPILLSAVIVFVASAVMHMALGYHRRDYDKLGKEDAVLDVLQGLTPGEYFIPYMMDREAGKDPAVQAKIARGPRALVRIMSGNDPQASFMKALVHWFVFALVVALFAAYLTSRALSPGAPYLEVFRIAGTVAFVGYGLSLAQESIWFSKRWSNTLRSMFDALIYGLLTGGVFGWLWPK